MSNIGYVYYKEIFAGLLIRDSEGYSFVYDDEYFNNKLSKPISLLLDLSKKEYHSNVLFPFFDGLIPEGWLLEQSIKKYKLDFKDRFEILLKTCCDTIGAVSIKEERVE